MNALEYVIGSYEQHFPETLRCLRRVPMSWFWRLIHALHDLGFIRVDEGGYFKYGAWTWKPWTPQLHEMSWGRFYICYPLRERLKMAWGSLTDRPSF